VDIWVDFSQNRTEQNATDNFSETEVVNSFYSGLFTALYHNKKDNSERGSHAGNHTFIEATSSSKYLTIHTLQLCQRRGSSLDEQLLLI